MKAPDILALASRTIQDRATQRDLSEERSMTTAISLFNTVAQYELSETEGWIFMICLKLARSKHRYNPDDFLDAAAYCALALESLPDDCP